VHGRHQEISSSVRPLDPWQVGMEDRWWRQHVHCSQRSRDLHLPDGRAYNTISILALSEAWSDNRDKERWYQYQSKQKVELNNIDKQMQQTQQTLSVPSNIYRVQQKNSPHDFLPISLIWLGIFAQNLTNLFSISIHVYMTNKIWLTPIEKLVFSKFRVFENVCTENVYNVKTISIRRLLMMS